jgi:hypothetical protein
MAKTVDSGVTADNEAWFFVQEVASLWQYPGESWPSGLLFCFPGFTTHCCYIFTAQ